MIYSHYCRRSFYRKKLCDFEYSSRHCTGIFQQNPSTDLLMVPSVVNSPSKGRHSDLNYAETLLECSQSRQNEVARWSRLLMNNLLFFRGYSGWGGWVGVGILKFLWGYLNFRGILKFPGGLARNSLSYL